MHAGGREKDKEDEKKNTFIISMTFFFLVFVKDDIDIKHKTYTIIIIRLLLKYFKCRS